MMNLTGSRHFLPTSKGMQRGVQHTPMTSETWLAGVGWGNFGFCMSVSAYSKGCVWACSSTCRWVLGHPERPLWGTHEIPFLYGCPCCTT